MPDPALDRLYNAERNAERERENSEKQFAAESTNNQGKEKTSLLDKLLTRFRFNCEGYTQANSLQIDQTTARQVASSIRDQYTWGGIFAVISSGAYTQNDFKLINDLYENLYRTTIPEIWHFSALDHKLTSKHIEHIQQRPNYINCPNVENNPSTERFVKLLTVLHNKCVRIYCHNCDIGATKAYSLTEDWENDVEKWYSENQNTGLKIQETLKELMAFENILNELLNKRDDNFNLRIISDLKNATSSMISIISEECGLGDRHMFHNRRPFYQETIKSQSGILFRKAILAIEKGIEELTD